jgi:Uma2 family endonuclease
MKFLEGAPAFAVEIRSEGDYGSKAEQRIIEKRRDYFAAGALEPISKPHIFSNR